jgi:PPOX class probable F420-dependent enzyme
MHRQPPPDVAQLTDDQLELFRQRNFAVVATLNGEGSPHMSVMWVDEKEGRPRFNTTTERAKNRHAERDPRVSILVIDRDNPYHYLHVEGLAELSEAGAVEHVNELSRKYRGGDYPQPTDRVTVSVNPSRVYEFTHGPPPVVATTETAPG